MLRAQIRRWLGPRSRSTRPQRKSFRPGTELLEERTLLDVGSGIVVGRTLSSYTTSGVQNNRVSITYTVYNQTADAVTGVLLTDTLQPGVSVQSASQLPDRNGQELAWSLGTIDGFGRASVTLTVSLANPTVLQLDTGARAFATLDAGTVTDAAPAAALTDRNIPAAQLSATPDANAIDPFIQEKAAQLDYDPQRIFDFLDDEIGYHAYTGSLRGARGTLWSDAGNALDVASLGVALMRASGVPAQYAAGTLTQSQARQLVGSMFTDPFQTVGVIPAGQPTADPLNDAALLAEAADHFWFRFDTGGGMLDADPLMPGAQVGQAFTAATGGFAEVPDGLRAKAEVELLAEVTRPGGLQLGLEFPQPEPVLQRTFNTVELVGKPLTVGHFVSSTSVGGFFSALTHTYSPYLDVGDEAHDTAQDEVVRGSDYQEVFTNFPFSTQVLTGLFLRVNLTAPGRPAESHERTLFDRIGYAARQGLGGTTVSVAPGTAPAFASYDAHTLFVLPGLHNPAPPAAVGKQLARDQQLLESGALEGKAATANVAKSFVLGLNRLAGSEFLALSDVQTSHLADVASVAAYYDLPRLVLVSTQASFDEATQTARIATAIDLRRQTMRVVAAPGQGVGAPFAFNVARGLLDSATEENVAAGLAPGQPGALGASRILQAAVAQGVGRSVVTHDNLGVLEGLAISAEAKARITAAAGRGAAAFVPNRAVTIDGTEAIGWLEMDLTTGETIGVTEDGGHSGVFEFLGLIAEAKGQAELLAPLAGYLGGFFTGTTINLKFKVARALGASRGELATQLQQDVQEAMEMANAGFEALDMLAGIPDALSKLVEVVTFPTQGPVDAIQGKVLGEFKDAFEIGLKSTVLALMGLDPSVTPLTLNIAPAPELAPDRAVATVPVPANRPAGSVTGNVQTSGVTVTGQFAANWDASGASGFQAVSLNAAAATVRDAQGNVVGSGAVALSAVRPVAVVVSGTARYDITGRGSLSFYGPAASTLGVSALWDDYSAVATGTLSIALSSDALTLNGQPLPAGAYTLTAGSATLTGSGTSTSPTFTGLVSVNATAGTVHVAEASGNVMLGGNPVPPGGLTLTGYTGTLGITGAAGAVDGLTLDGTAADALGVSASPANPTADQNTPATLQANLATSLAGDYTVTAEAQAGWTVAVNAAGQVTATPAPGLQNGTYPIRVIARSIARPELVAQTTVNVTVTATQPGVTLTVRPDTLFTVPFGGAGLPTAYQVVLHNTGPTADTFNLTFPSPPTGFRILRSATSVTIPAGQTGIVGVYLEPDGTQLAAPGTQAPFTVTATSASNPAVTASHVEAFSVPAVRAVRVFSDLPRVGSTPGTPATTTLTVFNAGNTTETVTFAFALPPGLSAGALNPVTLAPGETAAVTVTLTPATAAALNSTLAATLTASFGPAAAPLTASVPITVVVRSAQTLALTQAAVAAGLADNFPLAETLSALGDAVSQLQAAPADAALLARVRFLIGQLDTLLRADPAFAAFVAPLQPIRAAADAGDTATLLTLLPTFFNDLTVTLNVAATQRFTATLTPNAVDLQPGEGKTFSLQLTNTGGDAVTLNLSASDLPLGVSVNFGQTQVSLPAGATVNVPVLLSQTLVSTRVFTMVMTAAASVVQRRTTVAVAVRPAAVDVLGVTLTPGTLTAGTPVGVTAAVFNTSNAVRSVLARVDILDATGNVVSSLPDQPLNLQPGAAAVTLSLGAVSTTGLADGFYSVRVALRTTDGLPLPGRSAQAYFLVGVPVSATVSASASELPPGTTPVTTTITVTNQSSLFPLPPGKIVVAHDEWTLSDTGFTFAPADATQFARNLAHYFTDGGTGSFLVYSNNFSLTGTRLATAMQNAGVTWTVSTAVPFTLESLQNYDAVFVGGFAADNQVLTEYVRAGGNVYLCAGSGLLGQFGNNAAEAAAWNTFLGNFDMALESVPNGVSGVLPINSTDPLFAGVGVLYQDLGMDVTSIGPQGKVVEFLGLHELYTVYGAPTVAAPPPGEDPPPAPGDRVVWTGGASGSWTNAANWLDVDDNVNRLPTANDDVVIDLPGGATITLQQTQQTVRSLRVAAGNTLLMDRAVLTLRTDSQIDGGLTVDSSQFHLGGDLILTGASQWVNTFGLVAVQLNGHTLVNRGSMTLGTAGGGDVRFIADVQNGFTGGTLRNEGTIAHQGGTIVTLANDVMVNNTAQGTYDLTGDGTISPLTGWVGLENAGTLRKSGGAGTSAVNTRPFANTGGTIQVDSGTLAVSAVGGVSTGGTIAVAAGATLNLTGLQSGATFAGTYSGSGGGTVLLGAGSGLSIGPGGATFDFPAGMFRVSGATINLAGNTLTNAGSLTLEGTGLVLDSRDVMGTMLAHGTLLNTGTVIQAGTADLNLRDASAVTNAGSYQLTGNGRILSSSGALLSTFNNTGTFTATPSGTATFFATVNNLGTLAAQSGGLAFTQYVNNTGTIVADGAAISLNNVGNQLIDGRWVARNGGTMTFPTNVTSSQADLVIDGAASHLNGLQNLAVNAGTLTVTNGAAFATTGNFTNRGTLALGPTSTYTVTGRYTQEAAGTLAVQLGGAPAGGQFGRLAVTQSVTLGGVLRSELVGGYTPAVGESFSIVTSAGSAGAFSGVVLSATGGMAFQPTTNANSIVLTAQPTAATPTTTAVTSSQPGGATFGQPVTFTASVQSAAGTPTGTVQFQIDGVNVGAPVALSNGTASLAATLTVGQHSVAALYLSDSAQFRNSDNAGGPFSQTVNPGPATPAGNLTLYFTQPGSTGGLSQIAVNANGTTFSLGASTALVRNVDADGLLFLPNGNLLVGGDTIRQINPVTRSVVGPVINTRGDHLVLDPSGTKAWTSQEQGQLLEVPLTPFGSAIPRTLTGSDTVVTQLAFDAAGNAYYTSGGNFGTINLTTFTTQRLLGGLPTTQSATYDAYTGDLILVGGNIITQFDPQTQRVISARVVGGNLDHATADGRGHLVVGDNNGFLIYLDYSATGLVGDARTFASASFLGSNVDDIEFVFGSGAGALSVAVNHALPGSGYDVNPASLNPAGTLSPGGVAWNGQFAAGSADPLAFQLTGQVTDMAPGEVRQISQGTIVTAVLVAPNNSLLPVTVQLPAIVVSANHIINLTPLAQAADRNASVSYSVSLHNPLPTPQTYTLGVEGLEGLTTDLPPSVVVAAGQTVDVPFRVTVPAGATSGLRIFDVVAQTAQGGRDSVEGRLTVRDDLVVPTSAVTLSLTPAQASAGQGTPAVYNVLITNVGDATATFDLSGVFPPGFTATFSLTSLTISPGVGNGRNVRLTQTPPPGTAAGDVGFSVTVVSTSDSLVTATANGTVTVLAAGVDVALTPSSTAPGSPLQLTVTNRGQATDTFNLSLAGPAALVAHLATNRVTLAPGASQVVTITTGGVGFAVPGALSLIGMAQSVANAAVRDSAAADLTVAAARGVETRFDPAAQTRTTPGSRSFLLQIDNVGNTEDGYEVTILSATGGVVASLAGLDGLPTQTIPVVRLPGLASGAILLNADMPAVGQGTVTVRVRSSDGSIVRTATATLAVVPPTAPAPAPAPPPVPVPAPDLVPPGPPGVLIPVTVKFLSTRSLFRNEAGVFVLDPDGKIDGIAPGQPGFLARALSRRRVLVRRNQRPGATNRLKLQGGQRLLFYLVQNGTLEAVVGANPDNLLAGRPILFLSSADVNPDRLPHLRIVRAGKNVKLLWEDLSRGDQDFNDVVLSLRLG